MRVAIVPQVRETYAARVVKMMFDESLSHEEHSQLLSDIAHNSAVPPGSGVNHIDQEVFLSLLLGTRTRLVERGQRALRDVFLASDVNADGVLSMTEFAALLKHTKPAITQQEVIGI